MGLGRVPRSASFFCVVIHATFPQLCSGRLSLNLVAKHTSVSRRGMRKTISKIFTLEVICHQNLKSKVGQTGTSLRAGYRSQDALQRDTVYSTLYYKDQAVSEMRSTFLYGVLLRSYGTSNLPNFRILTYFPHTKPRKRTFR